MNRQNLKLTTVGLPVRMELLVRSMLRIVNARTVDQWSFADEGTAHVVLRNPGAAVPSGAQGSALPRYVSLTNDGIAALGAKATLPSSIAVSDLTALLDSVSGEVALTRHRSARPSVGAVGALAGDSTDPFRFGTMLQALLEQASRDVFRIEVGGVVLHVIPAARALLVREPINDETLRRILDAREDASVTIVPDEKAQELIVGGAKPQTIDWLLWRVGLDGPHDRLLSGLPSNARFALRRWPDFGRLKHDQGHLQLAARLTRAPLDIETLATVAGQRSGDVRAFVNACSLCDLIEIHAEESVASLPEPARRSPAAGSKGYTSVFRSIRAALGFGAN